MRSEPTCCDAPFSSSLLKALDALEALRIGCIGDVMIDVEVTCSNARISPEAPVLVFEEGQHQARIGGCGNVAANVAAFGCSVNLCSLIGKDREGEQLIDLLSAAGVECLVAEMVSDDRPTTRKTRFASSGQQLLRIDRESGQPLSASEAARMITMIEAIPSPVHCILVSDYDKGIVSSEVMELVRQRAMRECCPVLLDPKGLDWQRYGLVDIIKPNASELAGLTGMPCDDDQDIERALLRALDLCSARMILVTRAGDGASLVSRDTQSVRHYRPHRVEVADVCGAGDTNLAVLGVMLAAGLGMEHAVHAAQLASSLAVQIPGNAVIGGSDLRRLVKPEPGFMHEGLLMSLDQVIDQVSAWRNAGLTVGMTNGCFDLIHSGHVRMLQYLKEHCDRVIVALNSNQSVRRLKGWSRPILDEHERAAVLTGFSSVDAVTIFHEDTPQNLVLAIKPDVLCKGGDYDPDNIVGADFVLSAGGQVIVSEFECGVSTSQIVERIIDRRSLEFSTIERLCK